MTPCGPEEAGSRYQSQLQAVLDGSPSMQTVNGMSPIKAVILLPSTQANPRSRFRLKAVSKYFQAMRPASSLPWRMRYSLITLGSKSLRGLITEDTSLEY